MKPLILIDEAEIDVSEAYYLYLPRREGLADRFLVAVRETLLRVQENPRGFPREYQSVQRARILGFPHTVYFRDDPERIVVLAVFHGRRHPSVWKVRR
jgi:plasmid stabilization system protein ParE